MDLAKTLIRTVVRGFYETKHVLVIDALMVHSALVNEDLARLLGMQQKDLRKLCGKLKEDRLLAVHARQEIREGQQRPINKDYYWIDYHATIDAIKYRVFHLTERVKQMYKQSEVKKDYECKICKAEWTQLEVLDKVGPQGFECHRCGAVLDMIEQKAGASTGHEKQSRLMSQLEGLLKMLQQVDSEDIPNNTFEMAMSNQIPVPRDSTFDPSSRTTIPIGGPNGPPSAVKGMTQVANVPLSVSLTTSSEKTAYEKAVEAQQKADIAAQNALPVWHTKSTVNGESTVVARGQSEQLANGASLARDEQEEKKDSNALNDELTAYYAQLAKEKAQEEKEEQEADESSGDEDDEDFEDVGIGESGVGTASSSMPTDPTKAQERQLNGSARPKASESGSSRATSNVATPADTGTGVEDEGGSVAKKVKFETQEIETIAGKADKDSDEDDEAEFEDAL